MGGTATKQAKKKAAWRNTIAFDHYYNQLLNLAMSCFEWSNLPEEIDERYLELTLCQEGKIAYFDDDVMGNIVMKYAENAQPNIYNNPVRIHAYSHTGYSRMLEFDEFEPIFNNYTRTPIIFDLKWYAEKLAAIDRTIEINVNAQKTPVILKVDPNNRFSLVNMFEQYNGNTPLIVADRSLDMEGMQVMKLDAPYVAEQLNDLKAGIMNECLTMLGIDNSNLNKKERLITNEVVTNLGNVMAMRYTRLDARREAVERINKKFGTNIEVDYRQKMPDVMMQNFEQMAESWKAPDEGGEDDGAVHN